MIFYYAASPHMDCYRELIVKSVSSSLTNRMKGNGLLRINDIIRWSPISNKAGSSPIILSFQRGYLPLLRVRNFNLAYVAFPDNFC